MLNPLWVPGRFMVKVLPALLRKYGDYERPPRSPDNMDYMSRQVTG
jgi:hypothetical protein